MPQNAHFVIVTYWSSIWRLAPAYLNLSTLLKDKWDGIGAPLPHLIFPSIIQSSSSLDVEMQEIKHFAASTQKRNKNVISVKNQVTYSVNADGGYVAEVSYEGTAVFPEVKDHFIVCPNIFSACESIEWCYQGLNWFENH